MGLQIKAVGKLQLAAFLSEAEFNCIRSIGGLEFWSNGVVKKMNLVRCL